jgi:hypothetical protein
MGGLEMASSQRLQTRRKVVDVAPGEFLQALRNQRGMNALSLSRRVNRLVEVMFDLSRLQDIEGGFKFMLLEEYSAMRNILKMNRVEIQEFEEIVQYLFE